MKAPRARAPFVLASCLCLAPPLAAQSTVTNRYSGETYDSTGDNLLDTIQGNREARREMLDKATYDASMSQPIADAFTAAAGRKRIDAGQASTTYTPSSGASALDGMGADGADPAQRRTMAASDRAVLAQFDDLMKRFELTPNDLADARALAFTMAYTAYAGVDPGPERLGNVRSRFRETMLEGATFQALSDAERQALYERPAVGAMLATAARHGTDELGIGADERAALLQTAQELGGALVGGLWTGSVTAIELTPTGFGDRGERLASTGRGITTFERAPGSLMAGDLAGAIENAVTGRSEADFVAMLREFDAALRLLDAIEATSPLLGRTPHIGRAVASRFEGLRVLSVRRSPRYLRERGDRPRPAAPCRRRASCGLGRATSAAGAASHGVAPRRIGCRTQRVRARRTTRRPSVCRAPIRS